MSELKNLQAKLTELKNSLEGDLKAVVVKLESAFHHVQAAPVETAVKEAVASDLHDATDKVAAVADTLRSDVDVADKAVDSADTVVDTVAK
jgi:hypothetical protein